MLNRKFILLIVAAVALCQPSLAQFNRPQEIKSCSADASTAYDGVTYQNIPLGISFSKFKALAGAGHHAISTNREVEENGVQFAYSSSDDWSIGAFKWRPTFCFVDDSGVYRLSTIRGQIKDFIVYKGIVETLDNKYGTHAVRNNKFVWKVGQRNETAVMLEDSLPGWFYFHEVSLLRLGLERKQQKSPGL